MEYKRGHEERVTQFTSVTDTPEMLHAKTGTSLASDVCSYSYFSLLHHIRAEGNISLLSQKYAQKVFLKKEML